MQRPNNCGMHPGRLTSNDKDLISGIWSGMSPDLPSHIGLLGRRFLPAWLARAVGTFHDQGRSVGRPEQRSRRQVYGLFSARPFVHSRMPSYGKIPDNSFAAASMVIGQGLVLNRYCPAAAPDLVSSVR